MGYIQTGINHDTQKILYLDMELAYGLYYAFPSRMPQYMAAKNLKQYQFCICAAWNWDHEPEDLVHTAKITDDMEAFNKDGKHTNDAVVAKALHAAMSEADVIVAHNGVSFDFKHANSLFLRNGLGPVPEFKYVDTLKSARKYFAFEGNSLDDLLRRFALGQKAESPDWQKLTDGDVEEIEKATDYCAKDVIGLRKVFNHIKPFLRLPTLQSLKEISFCDACGSKRLRNDKARFSHGRLYHHIQCLECGKYHKGSKPFKAQTVDNSYKYGIEKCAGCGCEKLHSRGNGFDGQVYKRVKCSSCGKEHKVRGDVQIKQPEH